MSNIGHSLDGLKKNNGSFESVMGHNVLVKQNEMEYNFFPEANK